MWHANKRQTGRGTMAVGRIIHCGVSFPFHLKRPATPAWQQMLAAFFCVFFYCDGVFFFLLLIVSSYIFL